MGYVPFNICNINEQQLTRLSPMWAPTEEKKKDVAACQYRELDDLKPPLDLHTENFLWSERTDENVCWGKWYRDQEIISY